MFSILKFLIYFAWRQRIRNHCGKKNMQSSHNGNEKILSLQLDFSLHLKLYNFSISFSWLHPTFGTNCLVIFHLSQLSIATFFSRPTKATAPARLFSLVTSCHPANTFQHSAYDHQLHATLVWNMLHIGGGANAMLLTRNRKLEFDIRLFWNHLLIINISSALLFQRWNMQRVGSVPVGARPQLAHPGFQEARVDISVSAVDDCKRPSWGCQSILNYFEIYRVMVEIISPKSLNIKAVTGACKWIDSCSLELCSATLSVASIIWHMPWKFNSTARLYRDGLTMSIIYITLHFHCGNHLWS